MKEGDKAYVPVYGWFGHVGTVAGERPAIPRTWTSPGALFFWFHPVHDAPSVQIPENYMERYEWQEFYGLWLEARGERYGGKWFHSSNHYGKY